MTFPHAILDFWFRELTPKQWFVKDPALDATIKTRFASMHRAAAACELWAWRETVEGRLAEVLVLDQFSRNLYRDDAKAFATDALSLALAQEAVRLGADQEIDIRRRSFLYMPYMHSESAAVHVEAVRLFQTPGLEFNYDYELKHKAIIDRFGRYPHRNAVLGRASTDEEIAFLKQPGSSF